jgi:hypothetical protein
MLVWEDNSGYHFQNGRGCNTYTDITNGLERNNLSSGFFLVVFIVSYHDFILLLLLQQ